jgi:hypothetical protein
MSIRLRKIQQEEADGKIIEENELTIEEINEEHDKELEKYTPRFDYFLKICYDSFIFIFNFIFKTLKFIIKISGVYLLWISLHYVSSHLYIKFCVPNNLLGFLMSPFMTATPHCQGLRWIVYNAANMINNMWLVLGAWVCSTILIINNNNTPDISS